MNIDIQNLFPAMVGGDEDLFFRNFWRKRTLFAQGVLPQFRALYSYARFLEDYRAAGTHDATILISVDPLGAHRQRRMWRPSADPREPNGIDAALASGVAVVLQALLVPETSMPDPWRLFVALHDALGKYLLPGLPSRLPPIAAVDIFCSSSDVSTGGHYDGGDVFYFVLEGEKEWTVELAPDPEVAHALFAAGNHSTEDRPSLREHVTLRVRPGDCLYVPPYTYHRVCSQGQTLAVSVGLPASSEAGLVRAALNQIQKDRKLYEPLPSFPETQSTQFRQAQTDARARVLALVQTLFPQ